MSVVEIMSTYPYQLDKTLIPNDEKFRPEILEYERFAIGFKPEYEKLLNAAASVLRNKKSDAIDDSLDQVLNYCIIGENVITLPGHDLMPTLPNILEYLQMLQKKRITEDLKTSDMQEHIQLSQDIYEMYKTGLHRDLATLSTGGELAAFPDKPTVAVYQQTVAVLTEFLKSTLASSELGIIRRHEQINQTLTADLLVELMFISITNKTTRDSDTIGVYNLSTMMADRIFKIVEAMAQIMSSSEIVDIVPIRPKYLEMMHNNKDDNILSLNQRLKRYLQDLGVTDTIAAKSFTRIPEITEAQIDGMTPLQRLRHYATSMYQVYKLIVRDTVLYQFRSSIGSLPKSLQANWRKNQSSVKTFSDKLPTYQEFLDELLFFDLTGLVSEPYTHHSNLIAIVDHAPDLSAEHSALRSALGTRNLYRLLREAAIDSIAESPCRIRTETLLKYMVESAIPNLNTKAGDDIGKTDEYNSVVYILNQVAQKVNDMSKQILKVFEILNIHKGEFLGETQIRSGDVLTFVKIRNDNKDSSNRRFDIKLDSHRTTMMVTYETQETELYKTLKARHAVASRKRAPGLFGGRSAREMADLITRGGVLTKPAVTMRKPVAKQGTKAPTASSKAPLNNAKKLATPVITVDTPEQAPVAAGPKSTYIFGPFTGVYLPEQGAEEIAGHSDSAVTMEETVVSRLRSGQNVCIFGYGQSGSGKTSLLIYHKTKPDDTGDMGIMSLLCDKLQNDFTDLEVTIREIGRASDAVHVTGNEFYDTKRFRASRPGKSDSTWTLDEKIPQLEKSGESGEFVNPAVLQSLGPYVFFVTENKRLTKATTNNPTSSRSHVLIFLKFKGAVKPGVAEPTLIIGDFAGVENRFNCNDPTVLSAFATLKYDNKPEFAYKSVIDEAFARDVQPILSNAYSGKVWSQIEAEHAPAVKRHSGYAAATASASRLLTRSSDEIKTGAAFTQTSIYRIMQAAATFAADFANSAVASLSPGTFMPSNQVDAWTSWFAEGSHADVYRAAQGNPTTGAPLNFSGDSDKAAATAKRAQVLLVKTGELNVVDILLYCLMDKSTQLFMGAECGQRVAEGEHINQSLSVFRKFLSNTLKKKGGVPKIMSACGAIQCNPFYSDCFGSLYNNGDMDMDEVESTMTKQLCGPLDAGITPAERYQAAQACLGKVTYCIFNVINISVERNDPPPVPFIDSMDVVFEYNRVSSLPQQSDLDTFDAVRGGSAFNTRCLLDLKARLAAAKTLNSSVRNGILAKIDTAIADIVGRKKEEYYLPSVGSVIEDVELLNAPTFIGTMIFTDSIAKFGVNRMLCVLDSDAYLKNDAGGANFIDNMVFQNINQLKSAAQSILSVPLLTRE